MEVGLKPKDYYEILGVAPEASPEEIKKAYRRLARECHPDFNQDDPGAEAECKRINEAYEILGDPEKRRQYDHFRATGSSFDLGGFGDQGIFEDLFSMFFEDWTGPRGRSSAGKGSDLSLDLTISFEESVFGVKKEVEIPRLAVCAVCEGSGGAPGTSASLCPACEGTGHIRTAQRGFFGDVVRTVVCDHCQGSGDILTDPCRSCKGEGRSPTSEHIAVAIPAGVTDGTQLKMRGAGEAGRRGGATGNLFIVIRVKPHPFFEREGYDLYCQIKISIAQAALGAEIEIPTIDGETTLKIPSGTQSNSTLRLRGHGVPYFQAPGRGDQYVKVVVLVPTKLTRAEKELLKKFAALRGEELQQPLEGLFNKAKKIFKDEPS